MKFSNFGTLYIKQRGINNNKKLNDECLSLHMYIYILTFFTNFEINKIRKNKLSTYNYYIALYTTNEENMHEIIKYLYMIINNKRTFLFKMYFLYS